MSTPNTSKLESGGGPSTAAAPRMAFKPAAYAYPARSATACCHTKLCRPVWHDLVAHTHTHLIIAILKIMVQQQTDKQWWGVIQQYDMKLRAKFCTCILACMLCIDKLYHSGTGVTHSLHDSGRSQTRRAITVCICLYQARHAQLQTSHIPVSGMHPIVMQHCCCNDFD